MRPFVMLVAIVGSLIASDVFAQCRGCRSSVLLGVSGVQRVGLNRGFNTPIRNVLANVGQRAALRQASRQNIRNLQAVQNLQALQNLQQLQNLQFLNAGRQLLVVPQSFGFLSAQQQFLNLNRSAVIIQGSGGHCR